MGQWPDRHLHKCLEWNLNSCGTSYPHSQYQLWLGNMPYFQGNKTDLNKKIKTLENIGVSVNCQFKKIQNHQDRPLSMSLCIFFFFFWYSNQDGKTYPMWVASLSCIKIGNWTSGDIHYSKLLKERWDRPSFLDFLTRIDDTLKLWNWRNHFSLKLLLSKHFYKSNRERS